MPTAQQLFSRWLELHKITDVLDTDTDAFKTAYQEMCDIENDLHDSYDLVLAWDRDAQEWYLFDQKA